MLLPNTDALEDHFRALYIPDRRTSWTKLLVRVGKRTVRLDYGPNVRIVHLRHDPDDLAVPTYVRSAYYGSLRLDSGELRLKPAAYEVGVARYLPKVLLRLAS